MRLAEISTQKKTQEIYQREDEPKMTSSGQTEEEQKSEEILDREPAGLLEEPSENTVRVEAEGAGESAQGETPARMSLELCFDSAEKKIREILSKTGGKALLVSEGDHSLFLDAACSPRTISLVFDGDCLPLFSMPDGVSCVLASGGESLFRAARYFSEVRGISCILFPESATLCGAVEAHGEIILGGNAVQAPLRDGKIVCDDALLKDSLLEGLGRILLARLSEIEAGAVAEFNGENGSYRAQLPQDFSPREIVCANARQRLLERAGAPLGEGVTLSKLLRARGERFPEWRAFFQLSALYAAFFEKGKPRRYFTPDYRARAALAGTEYPVESMPTAGEYVLKAMTLERIRAPYAKAMRDLLRERERYLEAAGAYRREPMILRSGDYFALKTLPEHAPEGLSAVIRDFGLMEWEI